MPPGIFNKLRRRQSSSLPLRAQHAQSIVHHASTPPDWPTQAAQATPDVYITSPPEDDGDGLLTSVCIHRAVEHEPKRLRRHEDHPPPGANVDAEGVVADGPPAFGRSSLHTSDVVLPKKSSELARETAKWAQILNRQPATNKEDLVESPAGEAQWEGGSPLIRVSSTREPANELPSLPVPKVKATLRHRASKVFKNLANRESLHFGLSTADKRLSQPAGGANGQRQAKRRNTLSNVIRPSHFDTITPAEHARGSSSEAPAAAKSSGEGRRRSQTFSHVESARRPTSPPLPPLPASQEDALVASDSSTVTSKAALALEPAPEILEAPAQPIAELTSEAPKTEKTKKLQGKSSKSTFSHLFNLRGEKQLRSPPPPAKEKDAPVPPVPVIPHELTKAVADPDTPEVPQTSAFSSPVSTAATPKSSKSKRFLRHRRRATISSMSQSQLPADLVGTPSSASTVPQADTPKTPTSLRSRHFSIVDLRKGLNMRSFGKARGKLFSAKSSPATSSPPPPVPVLPVEAEACEPPATVMQRYKMSRPPPLQSPNPSQVDVSSPGINPSPTTVEFGEAAGSAAASLPSPTESEGPVTPMFGAHVGSTPALSMGLALAPAIELGGDKSQSQENVPELSFTPPASDESEQGTQRTSATSEATTIAIEDPLFSAFDAPSPLGDLNLQLREPSTKTSVLDAHLRLDSLRFDNFSFDTDGF